MTLSEKKCAACTGAVSALTAEQIAPLETQIKGWQVEDNKRLSKTFKFENFSQSMQLAEKVARVAEEEKHHPDMLVRWGELKIDIWTHKVNALTESDFILAAKIDKCAGLA